MSRLFRCYINLGADFDLRSGVSDQVKGSGAGNNVDVNPCSNSLQDREFL